MKPSRAGGCLKGARHCPQCNHFFKTEGPRPEPEGNGCGMGRRGPLWGSRSVFLLSVGGCLHQAQQLPPLQLLGPRLFSPPLTLLQKHVFSGKFGAADFFAVSPQFLFSKQSQFLLSHTGRPHDFLRVSTRGRASGTAKLKSSKKKSR